jgi:hypothetical protein
VSIIMSIYLGLLASTAIVTSGYVGPCSTEIARLQADAKLEAKAASGPAARESAGALMHRQPTPGSIAAAEERLGDLSAQATEVAARAAADSAGDKNACEQALADVQRAIGP